MTGLIFLCLILIISHLARRHALYSPGGKSNAAKKSAYTRAKQHAQVKLHEMKERCSGSRLKNSSLLLIITP